MTLLKQKFDKKYFDGLKPTLMVLGRSGSVVACWLVHWPLELEVMGSIPAAGEENFRCPNMFSLVSFAGMTLKRCAVLRIGTLTEGPLCRESHPLCRLKNPTVVYMITCRLSSCKTGMYKVRLLIILERWCSRMYRKKVSFSHKNVEGHL